MYNATLRDAHIVHAFLMLKTEAITKVAQEVGTEYTGDEQKKIVEFLTKLTDVELAYVMKVAHLLRDI